MEKNEIIEIIEQHKIKYLDYHSQDIGELAKALCQVQKCELFAIQDNQNPFFKSKYADLTSVWSAIRKPLTDNGFSITQTFKQIDNDNKVLIITTLIHNSGQWINSELSLPVDKKNPQAFGSAITYGRRYSLSAIIGIAPADDDAELAMKREKEKEKDPFLYIKKELNFLMNKNGLKSANQKNNFYNFCAKCLDKDSNTISVSDIEYIVENIKNYIDQYNDYIKVEKEKTKDV